MAGYKKRSERKRAHGGKAEHLYNAQGSPEAHEAEDEKDEFKRGGRTREHRRKHGGHVEGEHARHHLGKRARGGQVRHHPVHHGHRARGGSNPFSSARHETDRGREAGSPADKAPDVP